jgi:hypothetical protein
VKWRRGVHGIDGDDIGMLQAGHALRLTPCVRNDLNRHGSVSEIALAAEEDFPESTAAQFRGEVKSTNCATDFRPNVCRFGALLNRLRVVLPHRTKQCGVWRRPFPRGADGGRFSIGRSGMILQPISGKPMLKRTAGVDRLQCRPRINFDAFGTIVSGIGTFAGLATESILFERDFARRLGIRERSRVRPAIFRQRFWIAI